MPQTCSWLTMVQRAAPKAFWNLGVQCASKRILLSSLEPKWIVSQFDACMGLPKVILFQTPLSELYKHFVAAFVTVHMRAWQMQATWVLDSCQVKGGSFLQSMIMQCFEKRLSLDATTTPESHPTPTPPHPTIFSCTALAGSLQFALWSLESPVSRKLLHTQLTAPGAVVRIRSRSLSACPGRVLGWAPQGTGSHRFR